MSSEEHGAVFSVSRTHQIVYMAIFIGILALAWQLRTYRLADESIWLDEFFTYEHLDKPFMSALHDAQVQSPAIPPFHFVLAWIWARITDGSVYSMRMLSIEIGMASVLLVYVLGRRIYGPWSGLAAAAALAVSPYHVYYSQEIRSYGLAMFFSVAALYAFVNAIQERRARWHIMHGIAAVLLLASHPFGALLFSVEACIFAASLRRRWRQILPWALSIAPSVALTGLYFALTPQGDTLGMLEWIPKPRLWDLEKNLYETITGCVFPYQMLGGHMGGLFLYYLAPIAAHYYDALLCLQLETLHAVLTTGVCNNP